MPEHINVNDYTTRIIKSPEFVAYRQRAALLERSQSNGEKIESKKKAIKLGARATALSFTKESGYRSPEGDVLNLYSHIDDFSRSQTILDTKNLTRDQRRAYKGPVIEFNHALKAVIDSHPKENFHTLLGTMGEMYGRINGTRDIDTLMLFRQQASDAMVGMQGENAGELIAGMTPGYEIDYTKPIGVKEELDGIDLFIHKLGTDTSFAIDFKASTGAVEKARAKAMSYGEDPDKYVWSQTTSQDFNNSFRLPREIAQQRTPGMKKYFDDAYASALRRDALIGYEEKAA